MSEPKRGLRGFLTRNFNFSEWIGKDFLLKGFNDIRELFYLLTKRREVSRKESFAEAVVRLRLSEQDINSQREYYRLTTFIYGSFVLFSMVYAGYMFFVQDNKMTTFMIIVYGGLMFAFFFRESFCYMQITRRKLGHNFSNWCQFMLGRE